MNVYIAGPMNGYPNYNKAAFKEAVKVIESMGDVAINPARIKPIKGYSTYKDYWHINKAMLKAANAIYMLPGWDKSPGACHELHWALKHGLTLYNLGYERI